MSVALTLLMLVTAAMHAVAQALIMGGRDRLTVRVLVSVVSGLCYLPFLPRIDPLTDDALFWLALSVISHLSYHFLLLSAYRHGDFSQVHPLGRGIGPLLVTLLAWVIAGETLSAFELAAVLLISAGALSTARGGSAKAVGFAVASGIAIAAYTFVDGIGVRTAAAPFDFIVWFFVLDGAIMAALWLLLRRRRLGPSLRENWRAGVTGGLLGAVLFGTVMWALSQGPIAAIAALRETSVIFTAFIGVYYFREPLAGRRLGAAAAIALGVVVMHLDLSGG